jgi:beta-mannosidase
MLKSAHEFISRKDPAHRFVPTSPSGPNFTADYENYGKCIHWDVHGPWIVKGSLDSQWERYWRDDDSLFRSEVGAPGPSNSSLIKKYSGDCDVYPDENNPLWRRNGWWLELDQYKAENGQLPSTLEDYVEWGRKRQAEILTRVVKSCKDRFPECGGIILWMGHDCFPCTANTSLVDFEGNPKPAAVEISKIFNKTV